MENRPFQVDGAEERINKDVDTRQPLTENVLACLDLESRFYAVLSKAASKRPSVKSTPIEVPGTETAKKPRKCSNKQRGSKWRSYAWSVHMNEFTDKNEQVFLDACGAIGVEPNATVNTQKERYLVSEFLKNPVSWLETEMLYHSYTTRGEAQVANGIDRMINEGAPVGQSNLFPRPKHSSALSDTAFGS